MTPPPRLTGDALRREGLVPGGVTAALGAALYVIDRHEARSWFKWAPPLEVARGCLVVAALYGCARRWKRVRGAATLALLASVPLLPVWHRGTLDWLGRTLVGGWGDAFWQLTPSQLYVGEAGVFLYLCPGALAVAACVAVAFAATLFARAAAALCARPGVRSAALVALLALPAAAAAQGLVAQSTRAPFARWWEAYPVVVRAPASRVPTHAARAMRADDLEVEAPHLALTPELVAWRRGGDAEITLRRTPRSFAAGDRHEPSYAHLWCPDARASLVVRAVEHRVRTLVACEDPRTGLPWPTSPEWRSDGSLLEARGHFSHLYTAEALGVAAPPPWTSASAALGVLAACALLARRARPGRGSSPRSPYRAAPDAPDGDAADDSLDVARCGFGVALAAHAAAPLILAAWARVAVFR